MVWKSFSQSRSASKLFNEANERWHQRQRFLLDRDEEQARKACVEVIRLCQLSIEADRRMGDAYTMLANALSVAASRVPRNSDMERYEFLLSRAAAVIHFWYSLPHRGYPTTKNTAIGEQLWRDIFDEVKEFKALTEDDALVLMGSYRDSLAAEVISQASFTQIQGIILQTVSPSESSQREPQKPLETSLPADVWNFLHSAMFDVVDKQSPEELKAKDRASYLQQQLRMFRSHTSVHTAQGELLDRLEQAYQDNDLRQFVGWVAWEVVLSFYVNKFWTLDVESDSRRRYAEICGDFLGAVMRRAEEVKDWDALLLAVGLCEWAGFPTLRDRIWLKISNEITATESAIRHSNMEQHQRMVIEGLLLRVLRDYLPERE